jgi:hypothetical protein
VRNAFKRFRIGGTRERQYVKRNAAGLALADDIGRERAAARDDAQTVVVAPTARLV